MIHLGQSLAILSVPQCPPVSGLMRPGALHTSTPTVILPATLGTPAHLAWLRAPSPQGRLWGLPVCPFRFHFEHNDHTVLDHLILIIQKTFSKGFFSNPHINVMCDSC